MSKDRRAEECLTAKQRETLFDLVVRQHYPLDTIANDRFGIPVETAKFMILDMRRAEKAKRTTDWAAEWANWDGEQSVG